MDRSSFWRFYFSRRPRLAITLPLFLILIINPIYNLVFGLLLYVDFLLGLGETNLFWWLVLLLISPVQIAIYSIPFDVSMAPLIFLPAFWEGLRIWKIVKIILFIGLMLLATIVAGVAGALCFGFVEFIGDAKLSLWWGELWGVIS